MEIGPDTDWRAEEDVRRPILVPPKRKSEATALLFYLCRVLSFQQDGNIAFFFR
jgi:hypothetical protein